jgi:FkbM family methyltransferase
MGEVPSRSGSEAELVERISELLALPGGYPVFKAALGKLGYDLKLRERNWPIVPPWDVPSMQKRSFAPCTVIDVGAARGTTPLYEAFPDAFLALIEPLDEFADPLREVLAERPGELLQTAVGEREGTKVMNVRRSCLFQSTLADIPGSLRESDTVEPREVAVTTLDTLLAKRGWVPPFGLKIDVEGFEYQVLEGAASLLGETQFVITEIWPSPRSKHERGIVDIFTLLYASGFELCDILAAARPRVQREVMYLDMLFWRRPEAFARELD